MRVKYCVENGLDGPTGDIRKALNKLAAQCAAGAGKKMKDIYLITVVGNTCMHHLFLGISPASLAYAPYTPAVAEPMMQNILQSIASVRIIAAIFVALLVFVMVVSSSLRTGALSGGQHFSGAVHFVSRLLHHSSRSSGKNQAKSAQE